MSLQAKEAVAELLREQIESTSLDNTHFMPSATTEMLGEEDIIRVLAGGIYVEPPRVLPRPRSVRPGAIVGDTTNAVLAILNQASMGVGGGGGIGAPSIRQLRNLQAIRAAEQRALLGLNNDDDDDDLNLTLPPLSNAARVLSNNAGESDDDEDQDEDDMEGMDDDDDEATISAAIEAAQERQRQRQIGESILIQLRRSQMDGSSPGGMGIRNAAGGMGIRNNVFRRSGAGGPGEGGGGSVSAAEADAAARGVGGSSNTTNL